MPLLPNHPPRAAYIHVPFCRHRCGYCNFTLVAKRDDLINAYLAALEQELSSLSARYELDSLYFGGGTPSHLSPAELVQLFRLVTKHFIFTATAEVTFEANPLDVNAERLTVLREFGIQRLSLGVQSFDNHKLQLLERDHRESDIQQALELAQRYVPRLSLDLIFATPHETLVTWERDLTLAIATGVEHISTYGLTIEQGSAFYGRLLRGQIERQPEEQEADMYALAIDRLSAAGFEHYEVSNFAQPDKRSRHNETYWRGESYFAFGPGAARYIQGRREMNHRSTMTYIQRVMNSQSPVAEAETLSPENRARERLVFGLRMLAGVEPAEFQANTGFNLQALVGEELERCVQQGLLRWRDSRLQLTRAGLFVSDAIWPMFLRSE